MALLLRDIPSRLDLYVCTYVSYREMISTGPFQEENRRLVYFFKTYHVLLRHRNYPFRLNNSLLRPNNYLLKFINDF